MGERHLSAVESALLQAAVEERRRLQEAGDLKVNRAMNIIMSEWPKEARPSTEQLGYRPNEKGGFTLFWEDSKNGKSNLQSRLQELLQDQEG